MEFTTESGIEVKINNADFISATRLRVAVLSALKDSDIELSKIDIESLLSIKKNMVAAVKSGALDALLDLIVSIDCSKKVSDALYACLARSTYNKLKIVPDTFEPVEARGDYYIIVAACLKENVLPFFQPLLQQLNAFQNKVNQESPKSKS
jgi:hypothetical protein